LILRSGIVSKGGKVGGVCWGWKGGWLLYVVGGRLLLFVWFFLVRGFSRLRERGEGKVGREEERK
jgi:hypothetical protein